MELTSSLQLLHMQLSQAQCPVWCGLKRSEAIKERFVLPRFWMEVFGHVSPPAKLVLVYARCHWTQIIAVGPGRSVLAHFMTYTYCCIYTLHYSQRRLATRIHSLYIPKVSAHGYHRY